MQESGKNGLFNIVLLVHPSIVKSLSNIPAATTRMTHGDSLDVKKVFVMMEGKKRKEEGQGVYVKRPVTRVGLTMTNNLARSLAAVDNIVSNYVIGFLFPHYPFFPMSNHHSSFCVCNDFPPTQISK